MHVELMHNLKKFKDQLSFMGMLQSEEESAAFSPMKIKKNKKIQNSFYQAS